MVLNELSRFIKRPADRVHEASTGAWAGNRFVFRLTAAIIFINILIYAMIGFWLYKDNQYYHRMAESSVQNMANVIATNICGIFDRIDTGLFSLKLLTERQLTGQKVNKEELDGHIKQLLQNLPELFDLSIADSKGDVLYGTDIVAGKSVNIKDREYFRYLSENPDHKMVLSKLVHGKVSGRWLFVLAKRIDFPDGSFAGTAIGMFDVGYFDKLFSALKTGRQETVTLRDKELNLIAFWPNNRAPGGQIGSQAVSQETRNLIEKGSSAATYKARPPYNDVEQMISLCKTDEYPFFVITGNAEYEYLRPWRNEAVITLIIAAVFTLTTILSAKILFKSKKTELLQIESKQLAEEKARLEGVIEGTQAGTWEWNVQTGETILNERWAEIMGYSLKELAPISINTWIDNTQPDDLNTSNELLQKHFKGETDYYECERRMRHKKGHWVWILDRGKVISWTDDGKPQWMFGTLIDITPRKQSEEMLKLNEARYRNLIEHLPQRIVIKDRNSVFMSCNSNFATDIGIKSDEIVGKDDFDFFPAELAEKYRKDDNEVIHEEKLKVIDELYVVAGEEIWVNTIKLPFKNEQGEVIGVLGIFDDITKRKRMQEALQESEALLRGLFENMAIGVAIYETPDDGQNFIFKELNRHGLESGQVKKEDVIGQEVRTVFPGIESLGLFEIFQSVWKSGQSQRHPVSSYQDERITLWVENYVFKLPSGQLVAIYEDTTAKRKAEAAKDELEKQLLQSQKMESVGRLAGGVAHDFNNMLSIILGNTEMAMEGIAPDDRLHDNLSEIFSAARRSADITRQLLAFARKQTIAPKVLDLNRTIKSMLKMLQRLIGEDIDLAWLPDKKVWPVRMDPSQIDQILANLCVNARDAIADVGKITIETGNTTFDSAYCAEHTGFVPGEFVLLAISDDGCGMDQETRANLFEPFFTTKSVDKGTGLGLATVYGIVKQNDGFINVYSEPDQGTTFRIYLPRYLAGTESLEKKTSDKISLDGTETILLVEDEPSILKMTRMMLERTGYKVLAAGTPGEAIALAREYAGEIHLLMTDVVMPEMNGRDLAKNLLSLYPDLKRLFMSGYTANVIAHHGVLDEGVHFIQKPFSQQDLTIKVREALDEDNQ